VTPADPRAAAIEQETHAKAMKLLEALCEPCELLDSDEAEHEWRKCRRCLAHHEAASRDGREMFRVLQAALLALPVAECEICRDCDSVKGSVATICGDHYTTVIHSLAAAEDEIDRLKALPVAEPERNEETLFKQLSSALTKGNASTWDEVIHAAEALSALPVAETGWPEEKAELEKHIDFAMLPTLERQGEPIDEAVVECLSRLRWELAEVRNALKEARVETSPTVIELCARCGHPSDWHRHDDHHCLSGHSQPCSPGTAPFRCIGYDCMKDGEHGGTPETRCGCPDFVEAKT